ncbi:MAG: hypothetical protein AABW67_00205 [Nanoarchaeota archaeon]
MIQKEAGVKKKSMSKQELEEALLNNFINLQKVLTNLSIKFDELSGNMSKLLNLFEISAKSFAEKYSGEDKGENKSDKELLGKLDSLMDQNKTIAKGIMLMEERVKQRNPLPQSMPQPQSQENNGFDNRFEGMQRSNPLPRF